MDITMFNHTFTVDRVAFSVGNFSVYWYGVIIAVGFLIAAVYAMRRAPQFGIRLDPMIDVIFAGTIGAIICARAYYVIFYFDRFKDDLITVLYIHDGGIAIYGAVIGALLFGGIMAKLRKVNVFAMFDLAAIGFLIGQAVGRWGNFINQEAFGTETDLPWGMLSRNTGNEFVHPCFLYESLWCLIGFVLLHFLSKRRKFDGEVTLMYVIWYGFGRFFIEGLRTDSLYLFASEIRVSQLLAAVSFVAALVLLLVFRNRKVQKAAEETYQPLFADITNEMSGACDPQDNTEENLTEEPEQTQEEHNGTDH